MAIKYKYTLNYDLIRISYCDLLISEIDDLQEKTFAWNKYDRTEHGVTVIPKIESIEPVTPGSLANDYYVRMVISLTEIG